MARTWIYQVCLLFTTFLLVAENIEIAIRAAEDYLGKDAFQTVSDKFQFLDQLTRAPSCADTFHAVDVGILSNRVALWQQALPNVTPYYAVKANNDPIIAHVLAELGTSFDCASENEMEQILSLGVEPSRIVFANPRKSISSIQYAKKNGVNLFTFDSIEELEKMILLYPEANLLLRIKTDDSHSIVPLSAKFGATLGESCEILTYGLAQKAHIVGIAFHVGSNCTHAGSYEKAILDAAELFHFAKTHCHHDLSILDIGGGFPGTDDESFLDIANKINPLMHTEFPSETRFIAEPGRYFAARTTTLAMKVIGKKKLPLENKIAYYLSNGVYGFCMSSLYYEHNVEKILSEGWLIKPLRPRLTAPIPSLLWGPTCDSGDKILENIALPEVETGDFFTIENLGAYSKSLETSFNGIARSVPYYICVDSNL